MRDHSLRLQRLIYTSFVKWCLIKISIRLLDVGKYCLNGWTQCHVLVVGYCLDVPAWRGFGDFLTTFFTLSDKWTKGT